MNTASIVILSATEIFCIVNFRKTCRITNAKLTLWAQNRRPHIVFIPFEMYDIHFFYVKREKRRKRLVHNDVSAMIHACSAKWMWALRIWVAVLFNILFYYIFHTAKNLSPKYTYCEVKENNSQETPSK